MSCGTSVLYYDQREIIEVTTALFIGQNSKMVCHKSFSNPLQYMTEQNSIWYSVVGQIHCTFPIGKPIIMFLLTDQLPTFILNTVVIFHDRIIGVMLILLIAGLVMQLTAMLSNQETLVSPKSNLFGNYQCTDT